MGQNLFDCLTKEARKISKHKHRKAPRAKNKEEAVDYITGLVSYRISKSIDDHIRAPVWRGMDLEPRRKHRRKKLW